MVEERQRQPNENEIDNRIPIFVKNILSNAGIKQLNATIRQYESMEQPSLGEKAYLGSSRITGYSSGLNTYSAVGFFNSSDIPLDVLDTMRRDSQVALGMSIVKYPITNLGFTIECKDEVIKEFVRSTIEPLWAGLMNDMLLSFDYGFAAFEKVWNVVKVDIDPGNQKHKIRDKRMLAITKMKPLHPNTVSFRLDKLNNLIAVIQKRVGNPDIPLAPMNYMLSTYQQEYGNYFGKSRMIPAYQPWYWKIIATQFFLRWMERHSIPPYKVLYPEGMSTIKGTQSQQSNAIVGFSLAEAIASYGNISLPSTRDKDGKLKWDVEQVAQSTQQLTLDTVVEDVFNVGILRGLLIPDRKSIGGLNVDAATNIFLSTLGDFVAKGQALINSDVVVPLVQLNFPKSQIVPCKLNIDNIDFEKREEMRKLLSKMLDVSATFLKQQKAMPFNVLPDMNRLCEILDIPARPIALYEMPRYDPEGQKMSKKEIEAKEKKQVGGDRGPAKGEKTPGNQSRTGRDGTPRNEDKADQSGA